MTWWSRRLEIGEEKGGDQTEGRVQGGDRRREERENRISDI